jgi:hypothetical protein
MQRNKCKRDATDTVLKSASWAAVERRRADESREALVKIDTHQAAC